MENQKHDTKMDWRFDIEGDDGKNYSLSDFSGRYLVLYFYPKDLTPGCTIEAKDFANLTADFEKHSAVIVGVSKDKLSLHKRFKQTCGLPFLLLSDPEAQLAKAFGVWMEKSMFGKKYMGMDRSTFLISPEGEVLKHWSKVKVKGHAEAVLAHLKAQ